MEATSIPALALGIPDEAAAYQYLEDLRWHGRPVCPHCASVGGHYFLTPKNGVSRKTRTGAETVRRLWKCRDCRKQFSVLTGTVFHRSKVSVRKWVFVLFEMAASKNGVSAREIERKYDLTTRTAWHMLHRIREAMQTDPLAGLLAGTIIADETYFGGKSKLVHGRLMDDRKPEKRIPHKIPVMALLNRDTGEVRTRVLPSVTAANLAETIRDQVAVAESSLYTDEHQGYTTVGRTFGRGHSSVLHTAGEYVRGDVSTNALENFFGQLKRSIDGTHHAVSPEHLHRYCGEFGFRFSTRKMSDTDRMRLIATRAGGRRLTYRESASESSVSSLVA